MRTDRTHASTSRRGMTTYTTLAILTGSIVDYITFMIIIIKLITIIITITIIIILIVVVVLVVVLRQHLRASRRGRDERLVAEGPRFPAVDLHGETCGQHVRLWRRLAKSWQANGSIADASMPLCPLSQHAPVTLHPDHEDSSESKTNNTTRSWNFGCADSWHAVWSHAPRVIQMEPNMHRRAHAPTSRHPWQDTCYVFVCLECKCLGAW